MILNDICLEFYAFEKRKSNDSIEIIISCPGQGSRVALVEVFVRKIRLSFSKTYEWSGLEGDGKCCLNKT